jgi:hypothetical protein
VLVVARTRRICKLVVTAYADLKILCVVAKHAAVVVRARTVVWVRNNVRSASVALPLPCWIAIVDYVVCILVLVVSWSRRVSYLVVTAYADLKTLCVVAKHAAVVVRARTVARICCNVRSASVALPLPCWIAIVDYVVCILMFIVTWSWCFCNLVITPYANFKILCVVAKLAAIIVCTWSIVRISCNFRPASVVLPLPCWTAIVYYVICVLVLVVSWSRRVSYLVVTAYADLKILCVVAKLVNKIKIVR